MAKIDLHNYEAWFLDYSENSLSESQKNELIQFLEKHPELKPELEEFQFVVLREEEGSLNEGFKAGLVREEFSGLIRSEHLMVAEVEGEITKKEKKELAAIVSQNPKLIDELGIFHKTKLPVNESIIYSDKSELIQKERKVIAWWTYASTAAAAAIIAFVVWNGGPLDQEYTPRGFAWQAEQEKFDERLSNGIISVDELETIETVNKLIPVVPNKPNQFAQVRTEKTPSPSGEVEQEMTQLPVKPLEIQIVAEQTNNNNADRTVQERTSSARAVGEKIVDNVLAKVETKKTNNDFVPIQKFAKDKIKKDLLKGKTFSETLVEEIAEISNDKITFEADKEKEGLFESFALNIGKLSISRNK